MNHRLSLIYTIFTVLAYGPLCDAKPTLSSMSKTQQDIEFSEIAASLHLAHEASVGELFTHFSRRPTNKRGNFHQKVFEDERWIYWGKPIFKGLFFNERRVINKIYKTSKSALAQDLPIYDELWAHTLKSAVFNAIRVHRASHQQREEITYPTCESSLVKRDSGQYVIAVNAQIDVTRLAPAADTQTQAKAQVQYHILLSAQDFSMIETKLAP